MINRFLSTGWEKKSQSGGQDFFDFFDFILLTRMY